VNILALIPARGGSKGLAGKNIRKLMGHPLIAYSIKAATDSRLINRIIVSTDNLEIANISKQYGAEVPFIRPDEFAQDMSTDLEVFNHALKWLNENESYSPDFIVQLRPTSPVRYVEELDDCIQKLIDSDADSLRIITPSPCTPYKMWTIYDLNGELSPLLNIEGVKEPYNEPRQRLPKTYWQVGSLDVIRTSSLLSTGSLSGDKILGHIIPNEQAIDIDNINDFNKAEAFIGKFKSVKFD
jgi:CMP-N,N'-diacetyllegionaminic acid synthase